jgi:hypothetical protein
VAALAAVIAVVLIIVLTSGSSPSLGYDISYPQCSGSYPSNQLFGIVGVNGGYARNANPCLVDELGWAREAPGQKKPDQPSLSLYLLTGNPGTQVDVWPKGGKTAKYGACNGLLTNSCSYLYGEQRAAYSYGLVAAHDRHTAETAPWWLDVELEESWAGTYALNIAALHGYLAGLKRAGATGPIGIYSTSAQWQQLTGLMAQTTAKALGGQLRDWIAGTTLTLSDARANCKDGDFTGLAPTLAQYQTGGFDADLRCAASE